MRRISAIRIGTALVPLTILFLVTTAHDGCQSSDHPLETPRLPAPVSPRPSRSPGATIQPNLTPATVTRIVDGDTIEVSIDGQTYKLRYIGIDTPESVDPRRPVECFGLKASERNRELVLGRTVGLEKDVSETDAFGRLLRYIWLDRQMVNATLVAEGFALASTYPPDVKYAATFAALQSHARDARLGLWGATCGPTPSTPSEHVTSTCEGGSEPIIKGNISLRTAEKIYHVPGGEFYDATVIDETMGERLFCTEAEAVAAGWRKSLR